MKPTDTEMLDWLQKNKSNYGKWVYLNGELRDTCCYGRNSHPKKDIRKAIIVAMRQSGKGK